MLWRWERSLSRIRNGAFGFNSCFSQVKIGLYVPHDPHVFQPIEWKHLVLNVARLGAQEMKKELEKHGRDMRMKVDARRRERWGLIDLFILKT